MKKRYKRLTYIFDGSIEVYEYLDGRYGAPGAKREKKKKPSEEQIRKRNQWNKERKARHRLKRWFKENDYLALLTFKKEERPPNMKAAKKCYSDALKKIRREYKKRGQPFRWIRNIEVGPRGAWHIHMIVNRIPDTDLILKKAWPYGKVTFKHLYEDGGFEDLAGYITKTPETANRYKENLIETDYNCSKNIPLPEPKIKRLTRWKKEPKPKEGYYIEKETYHEGINPVTGYKYRYYTQVELRRRC